MRIFIIGLLTVISLTSKGQKISIMRMDSTIVEATMIGSSSNSLYTDKGTESFKKIAKVVFITYREGDKSTIEKLRSSGIPVVVDNKDLEPTAERKIDPSPLILASSSSDPRIDDVIKALDQFRAQRQTGKTLQLFGALCAGTAIFLSTQDDPNFDLVKALAIGGSAASGIGFIIDLDAGRHLKIKR